ncbi:MAG: MipA/OmpV family protein [Rhodobacteraceae bacterium]|nr:MipA/OmpV family protein [Paracoccaceae bacterium]
MLKAGPRVVVGPNKYNDTYFGVTAAESLASAGALAAYNPGSGVISSGIEVGATYAHYDRWSIKRGAPRPRPKQGQGLVDCGARVG